MAASAELGELALQHGRARKRNNAIAAIVSGLLPAAILSFQLQPAWERWLIGLAIGLVWGNAFEYAYHRWLLHRPGSTLARGHLDHHANIGTPREAEDVSLGKSPRYVIIMFAGNGIVAVLADLLLRLHLSPGIFLGWTIYFVITEEIHWRIHLGGWLPPGLGFARAYHMRHHDIPNSRFNVFLPLFDLLFGSRRPPVSKVTAWPSLPVR